VLFDEIEGCRPGARVVSNMLHSEARQALALGGSADLRGLDLVRYQREIYAADADAQDPVTVASGPVLENVIRGADVNLYDLPAVRWHEGDGGPYFTGGVCILKDPDDGWVNLGVYRLQIQDANTLSLHIEPGKHGHLIARKYWDAGLPCPIAISLGHAPAIYVAATGASPLGVSEYRAAGRLNGAPIEVITGETTGLPLPANSEVVLEGEALPPQVETRIEGPWGEATGYYVSKPELKPVVKVKCVMHRDSPIIQGAPPMRPLKGMKHFAVSFRCASLWRDLERCGIPEIKGVWEYSYGIIVIALEQRYAGHAKQAGLIAAGSRSSGGSRFIVIVDADIDPCDFGQVAWAMSSRCDPLSGIDTIHEGWSSAVDPQVTRRQLEVKNFTVPKVIINACTPRWREDGFPPVVEVSPALRAETMKKWGHVLG
jgi:UbiD family decarboxylase